MAERVTPGEVEPESQRQTSAPVSQSIPQHEAPALHVPDVPQTSPMSPQLAPRSTELPWHVPAWHVPET